MDSRFRGNDRVAYRVASGQGYKQDRSAHTFHHSRLKKVMVSSKKRPALPRRDFFEEQRRYQCFGKFCLITMRPFSIDR